MGSVRAVTPFAGLSILAIVVASVVISDSRRSMAPSLSPTPAETRAQVRCDRELLDLAFVDRDTGWALATRPDGNDGCEAVVAKTEDGGQTWGQPVHLADQPPRRQRPALLGLSFVDVDTGYAFGWSELLETNDGGATWAAPSEWSTGEAFDVLVGDGSSLWVFGLGARGPGVSVVDVAAGWTAAGAGAPPSTFVAAARIGQRGWFLTSGPDALYVTDDGWSHHEVLDVPCPAVTRPAGLSASEDATWLACGGEPATIMQEKHVYRSSDDGRTWMPIASTGSYGGDRQIEATGLMPSSGHLAGLAFASPDVGWLELGRTQLHRSLDGGTTWEHVLGEPEGARVSLPVFVDPEHAWTYSHGGVADSIILYRTPDAGETWENYPLVLED